MLDSVLIANKTENLIKSQLNSPGAALMFYGKEGSGKKFLAKVFASEILKLGSAAQLSSNPYYFEIGKLSGKQDIGIDQIRTAASFLKLKTPGEQSIRRVVLIVDAQNMNEEAQNALLKMLEEPPSDTLFILTVTSQKAVLPTIASRCLRIEVSPVSLIQANDFFKNKTTQSNIENSWHISEGAVGLLSALVSSEDHEVKQAIAQAKEFLAKTKYERTLMLEELAKDKARFSNFLEALNLVLTALNRKAVERGQNNSSVKLLRCRRLIHRLKLCLLANVSSKLVTDELVLNLDL